MGETTKIQWTDHTFSPWWGCAKVSAGCSNCYADSFSRRIGHGKRLPTIWGPNAERRFFGDKHWAEPLKWNRDAMRDGVQRRVFCASMADVFERREDLVEPRRQLGALIGETPNLIWLLLTKRPENMRELAPEHWRDEWPDNVWAGCTAEDQEHYDRRWPMLAMVPARVRFISHEPGLGPLCLTDLEARDDNDDEAYPDWIITGGESGPGARTYDLGWARGVASQCRTIGAAAFVKQLGADPVDGLAGRSVQLRDRKGGDWSEWPEELRIREFPS